MVLRPSFIQEILNGRLVIKQPQKPIANLPEYCTDRTIMQEFDTAADNLATHKSLAAFIDSKIEEICADSEATLIEVTASIEADTESAIAESADNLAFNFEIAVASGYTGDLENYKLDQENAYAQSELKPLTSGHEVNSIPGDFCKESVYEMLEKVETALDMFNHASGYS